MVCVLVESAGAQALLDARSTDHRAHGTVIETTVGPGACPYPETVGRDP